MGERRWRVSRELKQAARELRGRMTPAEERLWDALRTQKLSGIQFRRQHAAGTFVLDFFCPSCRLAVELDGPVHDDQQAHDQARTEALATLGIRVVRFRNEEVMTNFDVVLAAIRAEVQAQ